MAQAVKFYTDEHIGRAIVRALRRRCVDVQTAVEANLLGATDEQHLEHATLEEFFVQVTANQAMAKAENA